MRTHTLKAYSLIMVKDSAPRTARDEKLLSRKEITLPALIYRATRPYFANLDREKFGIIILNTRNSITGFHTVSVGNLDSSIVHPREVFKFALLATAAAIIFVHNHPSGDLHPSCEDVNLTKRLVECGELLGIPVLDHIIVSEEGYASMKSRGEM
jgi:DNA repair protein RadC